MLLSGDAIAFKAPTGIALDADGNLYVMDAGNSRVVKFDRRGRPLLAWGQQGEGDGQFRVVSENTGYLSLDREGNVYVADTDNQRIQKFDRAGKFLAKWAAHAPSGKKAYPVYITSDANGFVYTLTALDDGPTSLVQKYTSTGDFVVEWDTAGDARFQNPLAIASDNQGRVYVAEIVGVIYQFDGDGKLLSRFSLPSIKNTFATPTGLARDPAGNFYITDGPNSRALKVDAAGQVLAVWGGEGAGKGQLFRPYGVAVDGASQVYIVENVNDRVQVFAAR